MDNEKVVGSMNEDKNIRVESEDDEPDYDYDHDPYANVNHVTRRIEDVVEEAISTQKIDELGEEKEDARDLDGNVHIPIQPTELVDGTTIANTIVGGEIITPMGPNELMASISRHTINNVMFLMVP